MLLSKAIQGYLLEISTSYSLGTVHMYGLYLEIFKRFAGDVEVEQITPTRLSEFMLFLRRDYKPKRFAENDISPLSGSALDNHWKCLRSFFGWCNRVFALPRPDMNLPRPRFKLPEVTGFSLDEVKRIINACEWSAEVSPEGKKAFRRRRPTANRDKALVVLLLDTGLRIGEVTRLKIADVDLQNGAVIVAPFGSGQKTKPRMVYLGNSARRAMWMYLSKNETDANEPLFSPNHKLLRRIIRSLGDRAKVNDCHPHRFRHTFAIEYLRNGGDAFTLQHLLGHSTLEMVEHYVNVVETDKRYVHDKASPADRWKL